MRLIHGLMLPKWRSAFSSDQFAADAHATRWAVIFAVQSAEEKLPDVIGNDIRRMRNGRKRDNVMGAQGMVVMSDNTNLTRTLQTLPVQFAHKCHCAVIVQNGESLGPVL